MLNCTYFCVIVICIINGNGVIKESLTADGLAFNCILCQYLKFYKKINMVYKKIRSLTYFTRNKLFMIAMVNYYIISVSVI